MPARPGRASSRARSRRSPWATTTPRANSTPPASPAEMSPPWASTPPTRARSTSPWVLQGVPRSWLPSTTAAPGRKPADPPGRARQIWIDERSLKGDRTLYVAGPDALYIRREGRWRTTRLPGTATEIAGAPPVFYATVAGKIYVSTDGSVTWRDSALPGFQGQATAIAASADHPEIAYVSYSGLRAPIRATWGVAKTTDAGRHWEPVYDNVRDAWLSERFGAGWAGNPIGLGVAPHDAGTVYATDSGRVMRTTDGGKTWNEAYSNRTPDGNWTTNGIDVTTCYGVHFDPFDARHMFIDYTDIAL